MSLGVRTLDRHPDDAALVRHLDGEGSDPERAQLAAHLGTCPECEGRRGLLARRSRELSDLLTRTDAMAPAFTLRFERRALRLRLRAWPAAAAAAALVLGALALSATPVGAWIRDRWADVRRLLAAPPRTASTQAAAEASRDSLGTVWFTPSSDVLVVRVATRQASGSLLLEATAATTASAAVRGAGDSDELIVLPDELRIANTAASHATYRVTVPARLSRIVVLLGAEPPVSLAPALGERRTLDLSVQHRGQTAPGFSQDSRRKS